MTSTHETVRQEMRSDSPLALELARELGFLPETRFISACRRGRRVYLSYTLGHPEEILALDRAASEAGFQRAPYFPGFDRRQEGPSYWYRDEEASAPATR